MYYQIFLTTFITTSLGCVFVDFYIPHLRKSTKQNEDVYSDYKRMIPVVGKNLLVSLPVFFFCEYYLFNYPNIKNSVYQYPWFIYVPVWMFLADLFFYTIHRTLHIPRFYFLHKTHHEFNNPYGMGAIYCSPFEMVTANLLALLFPIYFLEIPENLVNIMIFAMTFWTVFMSHSNLQDLNNTHVIHHRKLKCNYGLFIMDRIMGTKQKKM